MENVQRTERGGRKVTLSLGVKQEGINGSGEDAVSRRQLAGRGGFEVGLPVMGQRTRSLSVANGHP